MTYDLNAAFDRAVQDDAVKVIILAGADPHFSAGHDLRPGTKNKAGADFPPTAPGAVSPSPARIDLQIGTGEAAGVVGEPGSGKSITWRATSA